MQFSVSACESCMLGCVLLDCNGIKCTGNGLSIPAAAFSQQLLRETNFPQVAISLLVWSFDPMIWMYLWQIWLQTMLWLTCRDFQVDFDDSFWETVRYEQILINVWLPCTANMQHSVWESWLMCGSRAWLTCSIQCVFLPHDMNVFVTALTADNVTHMQGFSSGFYGQPPYSSNYCEC